MKSRKTALFGLLVALAFVLSYIETLFPVYLGAPGIKLGLANLVTILSLYCMGVKETILVNLARIILTGFTFGRMSGIFYSLSGAALSLLIMVLAKRSKAFSMTGVSILGGVFHNVGQLLMAAFVLHTPGVFSYFPVLMTAGIAAGAAIGLLGGIMLGRVKHLFS